MNKNVLIFSAVFPPEPIVSASLSKDIASELSKKNKVTVLCPNPTRPHGFMFENEIEEKDYKVVRLNSYTCSESKIIGRLRESYSFGKHCFKYIDDNKDNIDVIYANTWPLFAQYFAVKAAKKYHIPITIHVQDVYPESLSNKLPVLNPLLNFFLLPIDKYVLGNATNVIAISNKMKNYLASTRKINIDKIEVVQNWQDEEVFINYDLSVSQNQSAKNTPTFMYLGNIGPVAGIDFLIDAFIKADLKNGRLVIAGSGSKKKSLEDKVHLLGLNTIEFWPVPEGKVPEIQAQADIMLLPIKKGAASSSIPSKLPAYMFSKRPIIASVDLDSDTARVIKEADCGWVLSPEDIFSLSEMMQKVAFISKDELLKMGENGFSYAIENLSKKNNLAKAVNCITETIVNEI
ncbi:MAG TPA: glycosyltransferase WbuB [Lutibacter sp.]|nr:glycosyltransferase WbuB [Lutibacter sp.]